MRLAWRFLPLLLCVALTSCAKEPVPPPSPLLGHTGNYEARAVIRRDDFEAEAVVSHLSPANKSVLVFPGCSARLQELIPQTLLYCPNTRKLI
jgi:hypothetical protein